MRCLFQILLQKCEPVDQLMLQSFRPGHHEIRLWKFTHERQKFRRKVPIKFQTNLKRRRLNFSKTPDIQIWFCSAATWMSTKVPSDLFPQNRLRSRHELHCCYFALPLQWIYFLLAVSCFTWKIRVVGCVYGRIWGNVLTNEGSRTMHQKVFASNFWSFLKS